MNFLGSFFHALKKTKQKITVITWVTFNHILSGYAFPN